MNEKASKCEQCEASIYRDVVTGKVTRTCSCAYIDAITENFDTLDYTEKMYHVASKMLWERMNSGLAFETWTLDKLQKYIYELAMSGKSFKEID